MNIDLPKIDSPIYDCDLPLSKTSIAFRPFKVRDQRLFAEALSGSDKVLGQTIKNILEACTFNKVDFSKLPAAEVEWLFLQIRGKSISEILELNFSCSNQVDGKECGASNTYTVDLSKIMPDRDTLPNRTLEMEGGMHIEMRYPTFDTLIQTWDLDEENAVEVFAGLVSKAIVGEQVYDLDQVPDATVLEEFINELHDLKPLAEFYSQLPKIKVNDTIPCQKCGHEGRIVLNGLKDFLT